MRRCAFATVVIIGVLMLSGAVVAGEDEPVFVRWMVAGNANDQVILQYWKASERDKLDAKGLVDLGTMLYDRGFPKDAIDFFRQALKKDSKMAEAWFRIGVVEQEQDNLRRARQAYRKCLNRSPGHGWANFYLGLLEEQARHPKEAMELYEMAFRHTPELADPKINPQVLQSKLYVGALLRHFEGENFSRSVPMPLLEPAKVKRTKTRIEARQTADKAAADRAKKKSVTGARKKATTTPPTAPIRRGAPTSSGNKNKVQAVPTPAPTPAVPPKGSAAPPAAPPKGNVAPPAAPPKGNAAPADTPPKPNQRLRPNRVRQPRRPNDPPRPTPTPRPQG